VNLAEFPDSHVQQLDAKAVIEAIYNSIDNDCYNITGHQADSTIRQNPEINYAKTRHTTHGWEIPLHGKMVVPPGTPSVISIIHFQFI
jgi:hypothetical protein